MRHKTIPECIQALEALRTALHERIDTHRMVLAVRQAYIHKAVMNDLASAPGDQLENYRKQLYQYAYGQYNREPSRTPTEDRIILHLTRTTADVKPPYFNTTEEVAGVEPAASRHPTD